MASTIHLTEENIAWNNLGMKENASYRALLAATTGDN